MDKRIKNIISLALLSKAIEESGIINRGRMQSARPIAERAIDLIDLCNQYNNDIRMLNGSGSYVPKTQIECRILAARIRKYRNFFNKLVRNIEIPKDLGD